MENTYLLANLDDEKAEDLGNVIANSTSRKILNLLSKSSLTEVEISKELKIPLSTVHYNIKKLISVGLVESKNFFWSRKGKKMQSYTLSKKLVLIAPKGTTIIKSKIKNLFTVLAATLGISVGIKLLFPRISLSYQDVISQKAAEELAIAIESTSDVAVTATEGVPVLSSLTQLATNYAIFFFSGALISLMLYILITKKFKRP